LDIVIEPIDFMGFLWLKSLHIIFVVTWFAGLFYIVRLFIYQVEAQDKEEMEKKIMTPQYKLMSRRLWYGITWPSFIITAILGITLLLYNPAYIEEDWMLIKLFLVLVLFAYHLICHKMFQQLQKDIYSYSSNQLRIWNEVTTLLLISIVFLVVFKTNSDWVFGIAGMILLALLLMLGIRLYKKTRA